MSNKPALLSTVPFSSFSQWDVKQFFFAKILSKYPVEELGKHLIHQTEKIQLSDEPTKEFTILGVSNKIGMFDGSTEKGSKIKQKYHVVKDNWLAYNPYRINVGSIGIKTPNLKGSYISPACLIDSADRYDNSLSLVVRFPTCVILSFKISILFARTLTRLRISF